jgi:hypothetical protein
VISADRKENDMATDPEYAAATAAALKIAEADVAKDVPAFFRNDVPQDLVQQGAAAMAKAAVDAVDALRAQAPAA